MKVETGVTYLVTTDNWFTAPDGRMYRAVFGTVHGTLNDEQALGIKTNHRATNWFLSIGNLLTTVTRQVEIYFADDPYRSTPEQST